MTVVCAREDRLAADEYIDVARKSGLNRPIDDRARVERMLAHANLIVTARQGARRADRRPRRSFSPPRRR